MSATDRRQLGQTLFVAVTTAGDISDRIAASGVPPRALRNSKADIADIANRYTSTPAQQLVPQIESGWLAVEQRLDSRVTGKSRTTLDTLAGQYCVYLALCAGDVGAEDVADTYLDLAGQHASESGDRLLADCVSIVESTHAFFRGDPHRAAFIAAEARPQAQPYARPMLAVCQARAAAKADSPREARMALDDVWDHRWEGPTLPGTVAVDEDHAVLQTATILGLLGDDAGAEEHARRAIATMLETGDTGRGGHLGGAYNSLCRAFLNRDDPDPEQAADAAHRAFTAVQDHPISWVISVTVRMSRHMDTRWPTLPAVAELHQLAEVSQRALPPAPPSTI